LQEVVEEARLESLGEGVKFRIANCAEKLASWAEKTFGVPKSRIRASERKLKAAQRYPPDANMLVKCKRLTEELNELHRLEESYWYMRLRANELRDGDQNSKYFHHKAGSRCRRNAIKDLNDDFGVWKTNKTYIERLITAYYKDIFATSSLSGFDEALTGVGARVTEMMNDTFDTKPTAEEIRITVF
jgi:hypothetical protein